MTKSYTTTEAAAVLGVTVSMLHKHRTRFNPQYFRIVAQGEFTRGHATRYEATGIDRLANHLAFVRNERQRWQERKPR